MEVHSDVHLLQRSLSAIRASFADATILVVSDGDVDSRAHLIAADYNARFEVGEATKKLSQGGAFLRRMLQRYLATDCEYLFKLDPDTLVHRPFRWLPLRRCIFGTVQRNRFRFSIQGGFIGMSRAVAREILSLPEETWETLVDYRKTWANRLPSILRDIEASGRISTDWMISYMARQARVPLLEFPEVCSMWRASRLITDGRFAVTHPHKIEQSS